MADEPTLRYVLAFTIDQLPPVNSADGTNRWVRRKKRKEWEQLVWFAVRRKRPKSPLRHAAVSVTRHSSVEPDYDNLAQGGKFILDALVDNMILKDDKRQIIGTPHYDWKRSAPRRGSVTVSVTEIFDWELEDKPEG